MSQTVYIVCCVLCVVFEFEFTLCLSLYAVSRVLGVSAHPQLWLRSAVQVHDAVGAHHHPHVRRPFVCGSLWRHLDPKASRQPATTGGVMLLRVL